MSCYCPDVIYTIPPNMQEFVTAIWLSGILFGGMFGLLFGFLIRDMIVRYYTLLEQKVAKVIRIMEAKYPMMQNLKSDIESLRKQEEP
jgi:hypothetical protein